MRIIAMIKRVISQVVRDKRTLALMLLAPLLILTLINFLFETNDNQAVQKIGVYNIQTAFEEKLRDFDLQVISYENGTNIKEKIKNDGLVAFLTMNEETLHITYENSSSTETAQLQGMIQKALSQAQLEQMTKALNIQGTQQFNLETSYVFGSADSTFFDTLSPILIGFFVFFFVFLIAGISLLRERTTGTLERLLATPVRRKDIVFGYLGGYGIFAILQTLIVVLYAINVLGIHSEGSVYLVFLVNILIAFVALSLGILLSTFAHSEFQMMQFIPVAVIPQIFFAGIIPVENMADWLQVIAHIMPLFYAGEALQGIMVKGYKFVDIQWNLLILLIFAIIFTILNIVGLKRYRKI